MAEKTLIVIDMQNDFITGSLGTKEAVMIVPNVKKKIEEYRSRGDRIILPEIRISKTILRQVRASIFL